jgi:TolB-like protein/Tfp pilus assembly protein PilF
LSAAAELLAVAQAVFRFWPAGDGAQATVAGVDQGGAPSIAVLPFVNLSDEPGQAYFSDGLTEELIDRLAQVKGLRVVSRTSSFAFKTRDMDVREIGRALGANALVEGSVRRDGEQLRISAQLVDAANGYHLWSESFDRRLEDVFAIQKEIARAIAETLKGRLLATAEAEALEPEVVDPEAYDLYLRGRYHWHRRSEAGLRRSADYFQQALERAPDYAPAWVGLGDASAVLGFYDYLPPAEAFPRAREAANRALELDRENASAWATLGYAALYYDWDLERGEAAFRRAIELDPSHSKAHQWYANLLTATGRFAEAEREMRRATELDPLSLIANAALGWVRYYAGRHEDALEQLRLTRELDPDFELAYLWSGWALEELGRHDEALTMLEEALERSGGTGISMASLARLHALRGETSRARSLLSGLEADDAYVPAYEIAKAHLALGEHELALEWLERAVEERSHSMVFVKVDPQLDALRDNPRFRELIDRVRTEPDRENPPPSM